MRRVIRYLLPLLFAVLVGVGDVQAQSVAGNAKNFPVPFGPTNAGRDFWLAFPANWDLPGSTSYYIRLYITSGVRTQVKVWAGPGIKKVLYTIPNDIVTVDLTPIEAQMFVRNDAPPVPPDRIFRRRAVHVESQAPIVVYGMNRTTYTSDGILAFPVNALGREYIVASYAAVIGVTQELPSQYMIIAPYNGTTVTITHPHRTPSHTAGETFTIDLDSGDVFSAMTVGYGGDMSGAVIRANKPVSVVAGQNCTYIPNLLNFCCCDHIVEMMLPTSAWGKVYHGVPFQTRLKGDFFRVFAKEPNTTVYVNGNETARLNGVGGEDGDGWFEYRALGKGVVEFTADKPIYVSQYNPSQYYDNVPSDPFYLVLTPLEQYQTALTFCTPAADFPQNFVNMVCDKEGFYEVEITPAGKEEWQPVWTLSGAGVPQEYTSTINGKKYLGVVIEIKPGVYRMRGKSPFAGYIYGFSSFDSYGYPLSVAVGDLTKPDKDAPSVKKTIDCNGTVEVTTKDLPENENIRTNLATIELDPDPAVTDNYELFVTPFEAGVTQQTTYTLKVTNKNKPAKAVVIISDMAGNVTLDTIIFNPLNVTMLPSPRDYGKVRVGDKLTRTLTLTNESAEASEIEEVLLKSGAQGFQILSPKGKIVLGPKGSPTASVTIEIEYTATIKDQRALQTYEDSVGVKDECGLRYLALVKAQVVKPMIKVTDNDFGVQPVGVPTQAWQMDVRNVSTIEGSTLTVSASSGPNQPTIFDVKGGNALQLPFTLEPGQSRVLQIQFTAPAVDQYLDTIFFTSDAMDVAEGDDYGWLAGQGVRGELYATNYDWFRRRESYDFSDGRVTVNNRGTDRVRITNYRIEGADAASFRIDNPGALIGQWVEANGGSIEVQATFIPRRTGQHEAKIIYEVTPNQDDEVSSTLRGYGTTPVVETINYNFGPMLVDQTTPEKNYNVEIDPTNPISFTIPAREEIDSVTVVGFEWVSDNAGGNDDYRYVLRNPLPAGGLVLKAGERYVIDGFFKARAGGNRQATLRVITSDMVYGNAVTATSLWTGVGTLENASIGLQATTLPYLCVGENGDIIATITNTGEADLTISGLSMDGGPFQIIDPVDPTQSFTLASGASRQVTIRYTATKGEQHANLVVAHNGTNAVNGVSMQEVVGYGLDETWNTTLALRPADGDLTAELGKEINAELSLDNSFNGMPTGMNMTSYTVIFQYNPDLLTPRPQGATAGAGSSGGATVTVNTALTSPRNGTFAIDVTGFMNSKNAPLVRVPFAVLFDANLEREMSATVTTETNCLVVNGSSGTVQVDPICGLELRMIELTSTGYTLDQNKPNPFNPVTKIRYAIGLDAHTTMHLYDASGRMVQTLVDQFQQPGTYELTLDVTQLGSGNYYYTIVSGDFKETKMLTVVK